MFNPLEYPNCLEFPLWLEQSAWAEHVPFAMFLVSALRPRVLVELGTYTGVSYCAFCQAAKELNIDAKFYAVDTWQGDEHAGKLEETVLSKLQAHHEPLYAGFSRLIQSTFDEALQHFADGSVDLLHIDGFHTYKAVSHDFQTWLPKMSERGVILFHDVNVREREFGVWKFWDEVSAKYKHFTFLHGHGLGVLAVGNDFPEDLQKLFAADKNQITIVRNFFHQLGARIDAIRLFHSQNEHISHLKTHEATVLKSPVMRAYRVLKFEGLGSFIKKARK